jgi:hypothetical protein
MDEGYLFGTGENATIRLKTDLLAIQSICSVTCSL